MGAYSLKLVPRMRRFVRVPAYIWHDARRVAMSPPTALSARDHMGSCGSSPYIHIYIENGVESGARERASQSALFTVDCTCSTNQYTRGLFCFLKGRIFENFLLQRSQALKVKGRVPPRTVPFAPSCMEYGNLPARPRPRPPLPRIHTVVGFTMCHRGLPLLVTTQHSEQYLVIVDGLQLHGGPGVRSTSNFQRRDQPAPDHANEVTAVTASRVRDGPTPRVLPGSCLRSVPAITAAHCYSGERT